jgi:putative transposase
MTIDQPNQVWAADITYIPMGRGFLYLVAVIDWASRAVLSWRLSNTMDVSFCVDALEDALSRFGKPQIFNTDQGSQFTSMAFTGVLDRAGIQISMDGRGRWMDNVFIERLWRSLKHEDVYLKGYVDGRELHEGLSDWIAFYNDRRPHQAHGYRTPMAVWRGGIDSRAVDMVDVCRRGTERSSRNERITVTYSCAEDDGRPIGIGFQEQVPNQSELLRSKAVVVNVGSKVPDHRGRWASESRAKANPRRRVDNHTCRQNRRRSTPPGSVRRVPDDRADGDRRIGGGSWTQASTRNCGNQILDAKGEAQAAQTARREYRSQDLGRIDP